MGPVTHLLQLICPTGWGFNRTTSEKRLQLSNVKGVKTWSSKGRESKRNSFEPRQPGTYPYKLLGAFAEKKKRPEPGSVPYVQCRMEGIRDDGTKHLLFPMFFLSIKAGKNGVASPEYANGILGLTQGLGQPADFSLREMTNKEGEVIEILNPDDVVAYLKANDGRTVNVEIKIRKQKDRDPQNDIVAFVPAEESTDIEDEVENDDKVPEPDEDDTLTSKEVDLDAEEDADFEPVPPPKKTVKKVVKK